MTQEEFLETVSRLKEQDHIGRMCDFALKQLNSSHRRWCSTAVEMDDAARFTLIALHPKVLVPLHDHPGVMGFHQLLQGEVSQQSFTLVGTVQNEWLLELEQEHSRLKPDTAIQFGEQRGNIHSFQSGSGPVVLISQSCGEPKEKNWYLPLDDLQDGMLVTHRIRRNQSAKRSHLWQAAA